MKTILNNNVNLRKFLTITIIVAVVMCAGALILFRILFRSFPDSINNSEHSSSRSSTAQEAGDSIVKDVEENLNQQLLAGRRAAPRPKTSFTPETAKEKSKSVFLNNDSPDENKKVDGAHNSADVQSGTSADVQSGTNEDAQADNDLPLLSISGHVLNQEGEPVHGIEVISFAKRLFESSENTWFSGGKQSTISDRDGFFSFQNLTEGEYEVSTKATERYRSTKVFLRSGVNTAVLIVEDNLDDQVYVFGNVTTTIGTPLSGVRVIPVGQATQDVYTDNTGYYDLPLSLSILKKAYTFRFIREGYRDVLLRLRNTDVYGVDDVQLNAEMEPINTLAPVTGTVTDRSNVTIEGARIHLYSASLKRSFHTISDRNGYFFLQNVEVAADYRLWVRQVDGYKDYIESEIEVPSNGVDLTVILDPLDFASFTGQMVDLSGNPVPWFSLWLRSSNIQQYILVTGDQDGYFFVEELPAGKLQFLTRSFPYFHVSGIQVTPGINKSTPLVLDLGNYEIYGYVVDFSGNPVPGSEVLLTWFYQEGSINTWSKRRTYTDGNGFFLFSQLGPGPHNLNVTAPGYQSAHQKVEVNSGEILIQLQ
jgi:protocatechuate 3,4-dioxygenase beta subunit